ncbi:hypothetical protein GCM10009093_13490 [Brevundimonas terrae]|jgi:hypothetical protein|uniref:Periplasmic heavy metal sensor n=1 Tax=Brevundimonas terrae TaxID=363631 RepID=A0ABN0Y9H8_9CAUL|nr:hypothetical protein [Brevundimonas terrae]NIJ27774.1 hypothetical protein [Brevundimonas terrae]
MRKMKSFMIPALAIAAFASAVPAVASAQSYGRHAPSYERHHDRREVTYRKIELDRRIDRARDNRRLDRDDAISLKRELDGVIRMERSMMRGGLDRREIQTLGRQYDRVEQRLERKLRQEHRSDYNNGRRH